jgi:hypothetical protein
MKKTFIWFVVLIILAGGVFCAGWIQFRIPAGAYGVYVTKTHGWSQEVVIPGRFAWTWEALLPTNFRLFRFTVEPKTETITLAGVLPSGEVYSNFAVGKPDFSYKIEYTVTGHVLPEALPGIAESQNIETQDALDTWITTRIHTAGESLQGMILARASDPEWISSILSGNQKFSEELIRKLEGEVPELKVQSVAVRQIKIPDVDLYVDARKKYQTFLASADSTLSRALEKEAQTRAQDELRIESLEKYGQLITKYPKLIDFLAVENKTDAALLEALGKRSE